VVVVAAGGVEPDSRHRRINIPSQANPDRQEVTAEPLADVVWQQSEGVYLDLTARRHVQGEQPCWCAVDEGHPVSHVWSSQVGLPLLVIPPLTGPLLTVSPIRDADGAVIGASSITQDVTEARQAYEAARSMIESSLDSLVAISPEGLITDANEALVKTTGIPRHELIGTTFSDCFTEPEKAEKIYKLVFAEGMAVDYPLTLRHHNGHKTLTEVLYNASVYRDAGGKVLGVFAAARDVTNQNQAHREIAQQQAGELDQLAELEQFQRLAVGRELKMIELKKEIEHLEALLLPPDEAEPSDQR